MTKTTIVSAASSANANAAVRRAEASQPRREEPASEPRALADWELVLVGGGDMSPDW